MKNFGENIGAAESAVQVHVPYAMLVEKLEEVLASGINPEVYIDGVHLDRAAEGELREIRAGIEKFGRRLTIHGPYMEMSPGSADDSRRLRTVEKLDRVFEVMRILRPTNIVFHAGRTNSRDIDEWVARSVETWTPFLPEALELGVAIGIENIFDREPGPLKRLVTEVGDPNFGVCVDAGHLNIYSEAALDEWFGELGPHIKEVHLHDNNGRADEHLPIGEGTVDFPLFFSLLREYTRDPVLTIEQHGQESVSRGLKAIERFL
jgi:sugar phosphate isomerase/epimerase